MTRQILRLVLLVISLTISSAVLVSFVSGVISESNSTLALQLNPLNSTARLQYLSKELGKIRQEIDLDSVQQIGESGVKLEPYSGLNHSMYGIIQQVVGNQDVAQDYFSHALKILPTEFQALVRRFEAIQNSGDYEEITDVMERLIRRWPKTIKPLAPHYVEQLKKDAVFDRMLNRFSMLRSDIKPSLLTHLALQPEGALIVKRIAEKWHEQGIEYKTARAIAIRTLWNTSKYDEAHLLFTRTLDTLEQNVDGIIFDPKFQIGVGDTIFNWRLPQSNGLNSEFVSSSLGNDTGQSLQLSFLGTPLKLLSTLKLFRLENENLNLHIQYKTNNYRAPKPIDLVIRCAIGNAEIGRVSLDDSNEKVISRTLKISGTETGCSYANLQLETPFMASTWNNRYEGKMTISEISIGGA